MRVGILGYSLSSLALAQALVNEKIYVDILFQKKIAKINRTRTLGVSKSNVEYFNKNIINIDKIKWKLNKIEILSDNLKNEELINFESESDYLFSIIKNFKLFDRLKKNLSKNRYFNTKTSRIKTDINEKYNLVINMDYNNLITKKYFNKKIIKTYNSHAYTTIIRHEKIFNDTALQIFTRKGPLAFLPISNEETSVVFSAHNVDENKFENFDQLFTRYNLKYKIKKINKTELFELKGLSLRSYYHKNILAFGDLLHRIHPLAGQGFNMTIRDIITLMKIIKNKINLGLPLDETVNIDFEKNAKHKNFIFSNGIDLIHEFFNLERKTKNSFLSKSVQIFGKNPSIKKIFTQIADEGFIN
tara:strand:- start:187 stop:1263 length:1077 start_codon:yes stop_codon:yes gene_type:complete